MKQQEFTIENLPDLQFRLMKISPVDLLAMTTQLDFDNFKKTKVLYTFALENIEVKQGEKWLPVKVAGKEIYTPTEIEDNLIALNQLADWFLDNVVTKSFTESSK